MVSSRQLIALAVGLVIGVSMIGVLIPVVNDNVGEQTPDNESVTANIGEWQDLEGWDIDPNSETVLNSTDTELTQGTDYEMNNTAGEIKFLSTASTSDGEAMQVSYTYQASSSTATTVLDLVALFVALVLLVALSRPIQEEL